MAARKYIKQSKSFKFESTISGVLNELDAGVREKVLRPAAYAGARVLYDMLLANTPVKKGIMKGAVYHWHDDGRSPPNGYNQWYSVGVNMKKAPHWHLLEFGHKRINVVVKLPDGSWRPFRRRLHTPRWVAAQPFLRPTWLAGERPAVEAMRNRLKERLNEVKIEVRSMPSSG